MRLVFRRGKLLRDGEEVPRMKNPLFDREPVDFGDSWRSTGLVVILILLAAALGELFTEPRFLLAAPTIVGNRRIPSAAIEATVSDALRGRILLFMPRRNYWLASTKRIETAIRSAWAVERVTAEKALPNHLTVTLEEKRPNFRFSTADTVYSLDTGGRVAGVLKTGESKDLLLIVREGLKAFDPNEPVFNPSSGPFLETLVGLFRDADLPLARAEILPDEERTVRLKTAEGWEVLVDPTEDATDQFARFHRVLTEKIGEQRAGLQYVDVRVADRVIYR